MGEISLLFEGYWPDVSGRLRFEEEREGGGGGGGGGL